MFFSRTSLIGDDFYYQAFQRTNQNQLELFSVKSKTYKKNQLLKNIEW